ncbi:MAG: TrkA family potassium uptake protein, partial [Clostridia bacterium]|nr:TrkA family potassium uptake protein [Clostridia bacterium]
VLLEKLGAEVVYPEREMAVRLSNRLETARVLDFIQLSEKLNISKMLCPGRIVGKTVLEAGLRARFGLNIIALENDGTVLEVVKPDHVFQEGDVLFLAGSKEGILKLNEWAK